MSFDIFFVLQLARRYQSNGSSSIDELRHAFELAERSSPGITEFWIKDMLSKMLPNYTEGRIRTIVDRIQR